MRDSINKVSQHGEKLDSISNNSDSLVNVVDLSAAAASFRRAANRVRKPTLWSAAVEGIQNLGSDSYKVVKIASESLVGGAGGLIEGAGALIENGKGIVTGWHEDGEDVGHLPGGSVAPGSLGEKLFDVEDEEDEEDGDVVNRLVSAWTTLPPRKGKETAE